MDQPLSFSLAVSSIFMRLQLLFFRFQILYQYLSKQKKSNLTYSPNQSRPNPKQTYNKFIQIIFITSQFSMSSPDNNSTHLQVPAFTIKINTTSFQYKHSFLKEKMQKKYLPQYWEKCRMDQKHIKPSCEDRLSELTTGQIDRIIDMEKIKTLLYDKKVKAKEVFFQYDSTIPNIHPHVYQANFLAKINLIAIKRNIRHEQSQGFNDYFGEQLNAQNGQKDKKVSQVPYKYYKKYKIDSKQYRNSKARTYVEDDQKSIQSIQDNVQQFEKVLQTKKKEGKARIIEKILKKDEKLNPLNRWFNGMSNFFLQKNRVSIAKQNFILRMKNFDVQNQVICFSLSQPKQWKSQPFSFTKLNPRTMSLSKGAPFDKYRIPRVNKLLTKI